MKRDRKKEKKRQGIKQTGPESELTEKIHRLLVGGMPFTAACELVGVIPETAVNWMTTGRSMIAQYGAIEKVPQRYRMYVYFTLKIYEGRAINCGRHVQNIEKIAFGGTPIKTKKQRIFAERLNAQTGQMETRLVEELEETSLTPPNLAASIWMLNRNPHFQAMGPVNPDGSVPSLSGQPIGIGSGSGNSANDNSQPSLDSDGNPSITPDSSLPSFQVILEERPEGLKTALESMEPTERQIRDSQYEHTNMPTPAFVNPKLPQNFHQPSHQPFHQASDFSDLPQNSDPNPIPHSTAHSFPQNSPYAPQPPINPAHKIIPVTSYAADPDADDFDQHPDTDLRHPSSPSNSVRLPPTPIPLPPTPKKPIW